MKRFYLPMTLALVFLLAGVLAAGPVLAKKPPWAGGDTQDKGKSKETQERYDGKGGPDRGKSQDKKGPDGKGHRYFTEQQRVHIHDYYGQQYKKGHCPPGLAKKHNGCMPPGQAKKWVVGRPLPRDVVFYNLPQSVLVQLGPPPSKHRFVRVAQDILLIATGTGMVVDAIDDLNWQFDR
ncbi:MAG: hypothetical protein PHC90_08775 [Syntrophorhabdaceae bacterium]|nr:hypothetical protein [Syntrophorhabdaceae bacterium]